MQLSNINKVNIEGLNFNGVTTLSVLISIISECHLVNFKLLEFKTCTLRITRTVAVTIEQVLFVDNTGPDRAFYVEADNVNIKKSGFFSNDGGAAQIKLLFMIQGSIPMLL